MYTVLLSTISIAILTINTNNISLSNLDCAALVIISSSIVLGFIVGIGNATVLGFFLKREWVLKNINPEYPIRLTNQTSFFIEREVMFDGVKTVSISYTVKVGETIITKSVPKSSCRLVIYDKSYAEVVHLNEDFKSKVSHYFAFLFPEEKWILYVPKT